MKQGSADDPFAEEVDENDDDDGLQEAKEDEGEEFEKSESMSDQTVGSEETNSDTSHGDTGTSNTSRSGRSLPYIYARDSVKDGRQQRPIFLRGEVENEIPTLVDQLEVSFGEDVYRTDVLEAAVVVAQENPELVEEVMSEWGYGWE